LTQKFYEPLDGLIVAVICPVPQGHQKVTQPAAIIQQRREARR